MGVGSNGLGYYVPWPRLYHSVDLCLAGGEVNRRFWGGGGGSGRWMTVAHKNLNRNSCSVQIPGNISVSFFRQQAPKGGPTFFSSSNIKTVLKGWPGGGGGCHSSGVPDAGCSIACSRPPPHCNAPATLPTPFITLNKINDSDLSRFRSTALSCWA